MVLVNRSRRSIRPYCSRSTSLLAWSTGLEVAVFVVISGGAGAALLWFVAQGEVSSVLHPPIVTPSPALTRPASIPPERRVCLDRGDGGAATAQACLRLR